MSDHDSMQVFMHKVATDPQYRAELLKDPRAFLARETGQELPADLQVEVHEADATHMHLVIPPLVPNAGQLHDRELEAVSGGRRTEGENTCFCTILLCPTKVPVPPCQ